jgi:hypothetical protein
VSEPVALWLAEARLGHLVEAAKAHFEKGAVLTREGRVLPLRFPRVVGLRPTRPCCSQPLGWCRATKSPGRLWKPLDFAAERLDLFQYEFLSNGLTGGKAAFTARVVIDLRCDGRPLVVERRGRVDERHVVQAGPPKVVRPDRSTPAPAPTTSPPATRHPLQAALTSPRATERLAAVSKARRLDPMRATALLLLAIQDDDARVRAAAIAALAVIPSEVGAMAVALEASSPNTTLRSAVARAIADNDERNPYLLQSLRQSLKRGPSAQRALRARVLAQVMAALRQRGASNLCPRAIDRLIECMSKISPSFRSSMTKTRARQINACRKNAQQRLWLPRCLAAKSCNAFLKCVTNQGK